MKETTQVNFEVKTKTYNKIKKECLENNGGFIKNYLSEIFDNYVKKPEKKYYIHVIGPDDLLGPFTKEVAHKTANEINILFIKDQIHVERSELIMHVALVTTR